MTPAEATTQVAHELMTEEQVLAAYLASRREGCPSCGYELHALRAMRCPECGEALRIHLALKWPNQAAFITGLCGLAGGLGFWVLLLCARIHVLIRFEDFQLVFPSGAVSAAFLVVALLWIRMGRRVRRSRAVVRWSLATACLALPPFSVALLLALHD